MAKIRNPVRFSEHFGVAPAELKKLGVLDPTLNVDTKLFIDPFLIRKHPEIAKKGYQTYRKHFETVIKLLSFQEGRRCRMAQRAPPHGISRGQVDVGPAWTVRNLYQAAGPGRSRGTA